MHRVYVSASTQKANDGVGQYGNEQDRMMHLADRAKYWLETQKGKFVVFRNSPGWTLVQTVRDCNNLACEAFVDNHSNAGAIENEAGDGGAEGTETFYCHQAGTSSKSYRLASLLYKYVAPISPGKDRGILPDNRYVSSLYVIQNTTPPSALIEHIFHTNYEEVADLIADVDKYAKSEAKAICEYCGETWMEPAPPTEVVPLVENKPDETVKKIQNLCNLLGRRDFDGRTLVVDGVPGPRTASAVRSLPLTKQGAKGDTVRVIQTIVGATNDGDFGPLTEAAVKAWQTANSLTADGIVGPKTWARMAKIN